jgi:transposase
MLEPEAVRRLEVITGTGRRRRFSADDKARIVEETLAPDAVVSEVARRHGLTPQQLFTWRRQVRQAAAVTSIETPSFVPAVVDAAPPRHTAPPAPRGRPRSRPVERALGLVEVEINGVTVRVGRGAEAKTVAAVLRALKAGA